MAIIKWTAERNERLLLLIVKELKVDSNKLAKAWGEQYANGPRHHGAIRRPEEEGRRRQRRGRERVDHALHAQNPTDDQQANPKEDRQNADVHHGFKAQAVHATDDDVAVSEDDSESLDLQNLPHAISRASLARSRKVPKRYEDPDFDVDKADDEGDDVPFKVESKVDAAATGDGEDIHVASAAPRGIDSVMGELMAEAEPKGQKMFGKKAAEWEDESDVSDFAKSFG